jgi:MATE family multidrug resistance protein
LGGHAFITFVTTNEAVRETAWAYIAYAAAATFCGAVCFDFDGVFIGATWTRDMRNMMLVSMALYLLSFVLLKPFGNAGLWLAILFFLSIRGATLYWRYRRLVREAFPDAQSAAPVPVASASRG